MNTSLSPRELGLRIAGLRKIKGLSQKELALRLNISRPSVAQIELGNRTISAVELYYPAAILGVKMDDMMSTDYVSDVAVEYSSVNKVKKTTERISIPEFKSDKFRNVVLYMLEQCGGKPNVGETVLNKLLYFSDFNYYELYEEQLTGATYRKLPFGPVPHRVEAILNQMIADQDLQRIKTTYYGIAQTRYLPLVKSDLTQLKASEKDVVDQVIRQMSDWSARAISDYSHQDMPWQATKDGDEINYELVFYREVPFSVRRYEEEKD